MTIEATMAFVAKRFERQRGLAKLFPLQRESLSAEAQCFAADAASGSEGGRSLKRLLRPSNSCLACFVRLRAQLVPGVRTDAGGPAAPAIHYLRRAPASFPPSAICKALPDGGHPISRTSVLASIQLWPSP